MLGDFGVSGLAIYPSSWFRVPYCDFRVCGLYGILIGHLGSDLRVLYSTMQEAQEWSKQSGRAKGRKPSGHGVTTVMKLE